jgi:hypothetical protein
VIIPTPSVNNLLITEKRSPGEGQKWPIPAHCSDWGQGFLLDSKRLPAISKTLRAEIDNLDKRRQFFGASTT